MMWHDSCARSTRSATRWGTSTADIDDEEEEDEEEEEEEEEAEALVRWRMWLSSLFAVFLRAHT